MMRPTLAVLTALTLALGVVGCGDDETVAATTDAAGTKLPDMLTPAQLAASGQKSQTVNSGRFSVQLQASTGLVAMFGAGGDRRDAPDTTGGPTTTTPGTIDSPVVSTEGEFSGSTTRVALPSSTDATTALPFTEAIQDGAKLFLKDQQGWGVIDASRFAEGTSGMTGAGSIGSSWSTIASTFDILGKSADKIDDLGQETLRGVPTVHRRFEADSSSLAGVAASALGLDSDTLPAGIVEDITGRLLGDQPVVVEGWFDADGIARKLHIVISSPVVSLDETVELWDPNTDVTIEVPTDARQLTAGDLIGGHHGG